MKYIVLTVLLLAGCEDHSNYLGCENKVTAVIQREDRSNNMCEVHFNQYGFSDFIYDSCNKWKVGDSITLKAYKQ